MRQINRKGNMALIAVALSIVVGVICLGFILPIGLAINQQAADSFDQAGWSEGANTTMTTLQTNILGGFNMLAISPTVMAGGGIISILLVAFGIGFSRRD